MFFVPGVAQAQVSSTDSLALVAIYDATGGDNWDDNTNWKSTEPVGEWEGVTVRNGVVTGLKLEFNNLRGEIPPEIGDLTSLQELWLSHNNLRGEIPSEIGDLTSLQELWLSRNNLRGEIPSQIGNLTGLQKLWLHDNNLSGAIPSEIGNLTSLQELHLYENDLSGEILSEIGNLTRLQKLWLRDNDLSGEIPSEIRNLTRLQKLRLSGNNLSGEIPSEIGNLTRLDQLWLNRNDLSGEIPSGIGNLTSLTELYLSDNDLSGEIPEEIANLTGLERLWINDNAALTGELPAGLKLLSSLYTLNIQNTCITTPADSDFQAWLMGVYTFRNTNKVCTAGVTVTPTDLTVPEGSNATYTVVLDEQPSGDVTITVSRASDADADITVDETPLTFTTENWDTAQEVTVSAAEDDDALNGSATIDHAASGGGYGSVTVSSVTATEADAERAALVAIYDATGGDRWMRKNNWKSAEPVGEWEGVDTDRGGVITRLVLSNNSLSGEIPEEIGDLTSLVELWLPQNDLSGEIPEEIGNLTSLKGLSLSRNPLSGEIPSQIGNLTSLETLTLYSTSLSGEIPSQIGNLTELTSLRLEANELSGEIPSEIGNLTKLEDLRLNSNSLSGEIPEEIEDLTSLYKLNLNHNTALRGELPVGLRHFPLDELDIRKTCITTPADSAFQVWLRRIRIFRNIDRVCGAGVTVTPTELTVPEGSTATYTVVLDAQPLADVTISVSLAAGSDADITADSTSLTFTTANWNMAQEVTVSAAEDADAENGTATIDHAASGGGYGRVSVSSVTATEDDNTNPQRAALVAIYDATDGDNWTERRNWKSAEPIRTWRGVTVRNGVVTELNLEDNNLNGSIPAEIGDLTRLTQLDLSVNELSGSIPAEIWDLSELQTLWLDNNALSGAIPSEIENLNNLTELILEDNDLSGDVPSSIENMTSLRRLELNGNTALTGELPAGLRFLEMIEVLDIRGTCITTPADSDFQTWLKEVRFFDTDRVCAPDVTVTPTALTVPEGSSEKYTVVLNTRPSAKVTITVSLAAGSDTDITIDKPTLTFTRNTWKVAQEVTVSAAEDNDATHGTATIEHAASSSDYNNVTVSSVIATEADNDTEGVTVTPTALTIPEGSSEKYTVVLDTKPSADVTITVSRAAGSDTDITIDKPTLTFTPDNWNAAQEVTVSAAEDTDTANGAATIEHSVSGGNYAGVTASSVTVTESDNDAAGVTINPTALTVTEGSSVKYTVTLTTQPSADVTIMASLASGGDADITIDEPTLTFTPDTWSVAQEVTVSAAQDDDAINGSATIDHAVSGGDYTGVTASSVTVTESDNDTAGVTVTPTVLTVTEGSNATYTVVLDTEPSADVTIDVSLTEGSDADITVDETPLTFTPSNWSISQEVTVSAMEDTDTANGTATIEHTASGGGYDNVTVSSVTVTEADNDTAGGGGVTVTPTALTVAEGGNATYTVVLDAQPLGDVTITATPASDADADITVSPTPLTFTPDDWETAQTVTVSAAEDDDAANGAATITHTASGGGYDGVPVSSVTVTEEDNDTAGGGGVTVTPTALTVAEGDSATYTVVLDAEPSDDVMISVSLAAGSDEDITADKPSLTFTPDNWNAAQEITVSAAEDDDATHGAATIEHAASGGGYDNVSVSSVTATEADNDAAGVTVTPTALTVPEGANATYTVVLDTQPSADVTISASFASGSDEDITVDKTSLTFTPDNWDAAQEITVSAAEDDDATNGAATITHTASGGGYSDVPVSSVTATEADNDAAGVTVMPTALPVPEGSNAKYAVVLDAQPSEDVTIALSFAAGSDEDITVDNTSLTFTPDNWDAAQEITVSAAEDDDAINGVATIEHAASGEGYDDVTVSSVTATELDNDTKGVTVTPTTLPVPEGGSATYTVVLDTQPSADVTISASFASGSDEDITTDKTSLTFTPDNWSMAQEVTVSAAVDYDTDDDIAVLNHRASGGDYGGVTVDNVIVTVTDVIGGIDVSAWLARSSRVSADHLLSSVENRMESVDRGVSGAEASVAGQRIVFGDAPARPGMELSGASALWSASQDYLTASPLMGGDGLRSGNSYGISRGLNAAASRYRNMTLRDALSRSAFRYARETSWGNAFGIWGQGAFSRFGGSEAGADLTGDVMSGTIGVDHTISGWLNGLAVSRSESEGAYRIAGKDSLSLSSALTGVYPYARYNLTDRLRVWGTGGYGSGSLSLQGDSLASTSDLSMILGSVGMSGDIVSAGSKGFGLSWQTDAMLLRSSLASSGFLASTSAMVHRLRLSLESSYILRMGNRASLAPKVQVGVRQDGGDAEQGRGVDVAGGLGFIHTGWGLQAQVDMHGLLVHEDSDFEEWGASGMILFDRAPSSELGMSLRLIPSYGSASSSMGGMRALWSRKTMSGLAGFGRTDEDRSLRLDSRFDYGFAAGEHGVASPYASVFVSGSEAASNLAGADVEVGGGLGYSNRSLGLRMRAGMQGLMSDEAMAFDGWGASGVIAFDPDPSSPLGASFNVSQSWGMTPRTGFGGMQTMGFGGAQNMETMRGREPLHRSVTGLSRSARYGQPLRVEGEMGYGFSSSGGKGVATPYAGVAFSEQGRSGVLLGINLQTGRRFLLNLEGSTPQARAISFDSMPEFRVRSLLKW